ncbi:MAG: hypothetical protein KGO49_06930 [Gammaproteobacteria bacterium]|nr:hypothetical protein [Gammaproteobacteria bacterium]
MLIDENDRRPVIYIHGFGSDKESSKFIALKERLDQKYFVVDIVEADYALATRRDIEYKFSQVIAKFLGYPTPIIVGHSLGGYWARVLSVNQFFPALLVNPSMMPWDTLKDKIPVREYKLPPTSKIDLASGKSTEYVYIELGDEIVDQQSQIDAGLFGNSVLTTVLGGHHRIEFIDNVINQVVKLDKYINDLESFIH